MGKQKTKQKGITLIALVITIIVLLILAGVSISLVIGDNGVLTQASNAVIVNREATAKEQVAMALASAETEYWTEWAKNSSVSKDTYFTATNLNEKYLTGVGEIKSITPNTDGTKEIKYQSNDQGEIYYFTVDANGNIATTYLVDKVTVGDYIDIGINYENKQNFSTNDYITNTEALEGWRVLSKSGSGITGTVTLVSAGCPLTFTHNYDNSTSTGYSSMSILMLNDMYKTLETSPEKFCYFIDSGFKVNNESTFDMTNIFTTEKYIDTSKGVHALGCNSELNGSETDGEIETLYKEITGDTKTMTQLSGYTVGTTTLKAIVEGKGKTWNSRLDNLMAQGQNYWIGGTIGRNDVLWRCERKWRY